MVIGLPAVDSLPVTSAGQRRGTEHGDDEEQNSQGTSHDVTPL